MSFAAEAETTIFVAAFPGNEKWATPGSFTFVKKGENTYLIVAKDELHVRMPVKLRPSPHSSETYTVKFFDAVYIADDGLSSVVVTGRFTDTEGDGTIAIHKAAVTNEQQGSIELSPFVLASLKTGQATGSSEPSP